MQNELPVTSRGSLSTAAQSQQQLSVSVLPSSASMARHLPRIGCQSTVDYEYKLLKAPSLPQYFPALPDLL